MTKAISALTLAAGASNRMPNKIKQLLPWDNTTLLGNTIHQVSPLVDAVHVVLGAYADEIRPTLSKQVIAHVNPNWESGMGASIAYGVSQILKNEKVPDAILILVPDQPLMDTMHFDKLKETYLKNENVNLVATHYGNQRHGVPAIFDHSLFSELQSLRKDFGAKKIIQNHLSVAKLIPGNGKEIDVDTYESYLQLIKDTSKGSSI
ncbi:nucleotidyltransferase family protein [Flagellimonas meridianipacifica]|uniref:Molybdenum cofactor cytidylyltransferase n=1 Tax=Flagellimonas meridianipacifica TaxID=1080225 RepID=A0A2T0MBX3_9FLAO|nr:nucleotidyltransferase family protein [Allomuricauda pacifica]PRX54998.1 molybdenum cofactor cytidylyltransferase [Allomuricauda pacifica]